MNKKQIIFPIEIKAVNHPRSYILQKAFTNDLNSVELVFKLTDCTTSDLTGATASILLFMRDGSFFQDIPTISGTDVKYTLTEAQGNHAGVAQAQLIVKSGSNEWASDKQKFEIIAGLETVVATEVMIKDWTMLTAEARAYLDEFEANEVTRQQTFTTNEAGRQSTFTANEATRETNETARKAAESGRVNAEQGRTTAESGRVTAESARVTAEQGRADAEVIRQTGYAQMSANIATKADKLMATNLVTNGDFSNGATGWKAASSIISASSNVLTVIGSGASQCVGVKHGLQTPSNYSNHKLYYRFKAKKVNSEAQCIMFMFSTSDGNIQTSYNIPVGVETALSGIISLGSNLNAIDFYTFSPYADATTANGKVTEYKEMFSIDLTATFGAGNEPTKEQMDRLLAEFPNSWFDGTKEILPLKIINSLGSIQPASVAPTLLNGRAGTLSYDYTNSGLIMLKGTASGGTLNTDIMVLRAGHRPASTLSFAVVANGALGVITISPAGVVRQTAGAVTNVNFDGIVFKAVQ